MISMVPNTARPMRQVRPDDLAAPVADGGDAVEGPLDAGAVVLAERADVVDDVLDVRLGDLALEQDLLAAAAEARLRAAPEVHHDLDDVRSAGSARTRSPISGGSASSSASMSSVVSRRSRSGTAVLQAVVAGRWVIGRPARAPVRRRARASP